MSNNTEVEIRYLEIDPEQLKKKLHELKAQDLGEDFLKEIIFYDKEMTFRKNRQVVRLRRTKDTIFLTYKKHSYETSTSTEIEIKVDDEEKTILFLESIGLVAFRRQEKRRHTFKLDGITIDIDWWPSVPPYVELEGESETQLVEMAKRLELEGKMVIDPAGVVLEKYYNIMVHDLHFFTFDKIE